MDKSTVLKLLFPEQHTCNYIEHFYRLDQWKAANLEKILHSTSFHRLGERSDTKQKM